MAGGATGATGPGVGTTSVPWVRFSAPRIAITTQPANTTIVGGSCTFSVTAVSTQGPLLYQWQVSTNSGSSYADISGATSSSVTVTGLTSANTGNRYRCVLTISGRTITLTSNYASPQ